jgi:hypothetical protein
MRKMGKTWRLNMKKHHNIKARVLILRGLLQECLKMLSNKLKILKRKRKKCNERYIFIVLKRVPLEIVRGINL